MNDDVKLFVDYIRQLMNKLNKDFMNQTNQTLSLKDVVYYCSMMVSNNYSFNMIDSHLKIEKIIQISKNSLIRTKKKLDSDYILNMNNKLIDYIYKDNERRILAVDGSNIELLACLKKKVSDTAKARIIVWH